MAPGSRTQMPVLLRSSAINEFIVLKPTRPLWYNNLNRPLSPSLGESQTPVPPVLEEVLTLRLVLSQPLTAEKVETLGKGLLQLNFTENLGIGQFIWGGLAGENQGTADGKGEAKDGREGE